MFQSPKNYADLVCGVMNCRPQKCGKRAQTCDDKKIYFLIKRAFVLGSQNAAQTSIAQAKSTRFVVSEKARRILVLSSMLRHVAQATRRVKSARSRFSAVKQSTMTNIECCSLRRRQLGRTNSARAELRRGVQIANCDLIFDNVFRAAANPRRRHRRLQRDKHRRLRHHRRPAYIESTRTSRKPPK